jgi:hypothetical protein
MRRAIWILIVSVVTVGIAAGIVRAQIVFPDGSTQETAFPGFTQVPTGAAYTRTQFFPAGSSSGPLATDVVPAGQELVVLKVIGWNTILSTLESRLPSPNQNNFPITLAMLVRSDASNNTLFEMDFPDGAVVVDEGRQPFLAFRSGTNFSLTTTAGAQTFTVIGYLRLKS